MGTVLAIVGAYVLAGEIAAASGSMEDVKRVFGRYEERMREYVAKAQRIPLGGWVVRLANPQSWAGVWVWRAVVWIVAWTGVWKLLSFGKGGDGFVLPEYDFEACCER